MNQAVYDAARAAFDGKTKPRTGLETALNATRGVVAALDNKGEVLGTASVS